MSVKLKENSYVKLREYEPSYQAMTRNGDTSNTYDIKQRFVRNSEQNDFTENFVNWNWNDNKGLLSDGKYIDKRNFFTHSVKNTDSSGNRTLSVNSIKYFKFKMNCVLERKTIRNTDDTYILQKNDENIYKIEWRMDSDNNMVYYYDTTAEGTDQSGKISVSNTYSSYPLQRLDKLANYELGSLFLYLNGIKIPDNEIFVYTTSTFTDIFIPLNYLGNVNDDSTDIDITFSVNVRQVGSEDFYFQSNQFTGNYIDIDLSKAEYLYDRWKTNTVTADNTVVYSNGRLVRVKSAEYLDNEKKRVRFTFNNYLNGSIELYVLNNIIYRHHPNKDDTDTNINDSKLFFFLNEKEFEQDFINGPITKNAVSFFYNGERIDDSLITQNSRYSFEYQIERDNFDINKIDFFVEDINFRIDDKSYIAYGQDYYLLNMLGVSRCVDKMKGKKSYSVFDEDDYSISFRDVLSDNGTLFDIEKARNYYENLEENYNNDSDRCQQLIIKNPSLLREMLRQFATPSKKFIVRGNASDIRFTSVKELKTENDLTYYKIYCNHLLLSDNDYTIKREGLIDFITVNKSSVSAESNVFEVYQYDLTYYKQSVFRGRIDDTFEVIYSGSNTITGYSKVYSKSELPFGNDFLLDDISALEEIHKDWFDQSDEEYFMIYPSAENKGFRTVRSFNIENIDENHVKITILLRNPTQNRNYFFLLYKNYNIVNSFTYHNDDASYMSDNDLMFPVYSQYVDYGYRDDGTQYVKEIIDYIPYINNSEPMVTRNGKELIIGEDYLYTTPEKSNSVATSFIILKTQTMENDVITTQFNSAKTNILVLGYNNLDIDNKYGLIYFSELKYPVDPEYMNIFVNGEKISKYDITILSDKLIRVYNIHRPIKSVLITTNLDYKESELDAYIGVYKETEFEKLLEKMFANCDPSKNKASSNLNPDYIYTVTPTLVTDVGTIENEAYKTNHGFDLYVDDVLKAENPLDSDNSVVKSSDILQIMFINWFCKSGKTRSVYYPERYINPKVLKYFSVFENFVVGNRLDIVMDAGKVYDGVPGDITGEPIKTGMDLKRTLIYPGANINLKRQYFYEKILKPVIEAQRDGEELQSSIRDGTIKDPVFDALKKSENANILYFEDFPVEPDENGIRWTGTDKSYIADRNYDKNNN